MDRDTHATFDRQAEFARSSISPAQLKDPINLIDRPTRFDVPDEIKGAIEAIREGRTPTRPTQGIARFRDRDHRTEKKSPRKFPGKSGDVLLAAGASGGLVLSIASMVNPGDEVIFLDPYFLE